MRANTARAVLNKKRRLAWSSTLNLFSLSTWMVVLWQTGLYITYIMWREGQLFEQELVFISLSAAPVLRLNWHCLGERWSRGGRRHAGRERGTKCKSKTGPFWLLELIHVEHTHSWDKYARNSFRSFVVINSRSVTSEVWPDLSFYH